MTRFNRRRAPRFIAMLAVGLFACGTTERPETSSTARTDSVVPPPNAPWVLSPDGAGPLTVGMSIADARAALGGDLTVADSAAACTYGRSPRAPAGVQFMIVDGRIARIEVDSGSVATVEGARVGDTEAGVAAKYLNRMINTMPHKYTSGRYLIVRAASDSMRRIVFETDGNRVVRFRAGLMPAVEWVEGCS